MRLQTIAQSLVCSLPPPNPSPLTIAPRECLSSDLASHRFLTVAVIRAKMSKLVAVSDTRSYNMNWEQLKEQLLALPHTSQAGGVPLLARIRRLTGNLFWEDVYAGLDRQSAAAVYLFKRTADDVFLNFGQDSSVSLDSKLGDGRKAIYHIDEALTPLVQFVQTSLSGQPWEESMDYLREAAAKYLELVDRFSKRGRSFTKEEA